MRIYKAKGMLLDGKAFQIIPMEFTVRIEKTGDFTTMSFVPSPNGEDTLDMFGYDIVVTPEIREALK